MGPIPKSKARAVIDSLGRLLNFKLISFSYRHRAKEAGIGFTSDEPFIGKEIHKIIADNQIERWGFEAKEDSGS